MLLYAASGNIKNNMCFEKYCNNRIKIYLNEHCYYITTHMSYRSFTKISENNKYEHYVLYYNVNLIYNILYNKLDQSFSTYHNINKPEKRSISFCKYFDICRDIIILLEHIHIYVNTCLLLKNNIIIPDICSYIKNILNLKRLKIILY